MQQRGMPHKHTLLRAATHTPTPLLTSPPNQKHTVLCQMKVSKEVQALRDFEAALLKGYQAYLKTLLAAATAAANSSSSSSARLATARVAVRCMGQLLVAKPGFNYSSDLLQVREEVV